jgi:hypothetical protein
VAVNRGSIVAGPAGAATGCTFSVHAGGAAAGAALVLATRGSLEQETIVTTTAASTTSTDNLNRISAPCH